MATASTNPLVPYLDRQRAIILDGGLATALEERGHDLADDLWSARLLIEDPDAIRQVHLDFLTAGADCVTTSSYQATIRGFLARGLAELEGRDLLRLSTRLATEARTAFWSEGRATGRRLFPLVAASIGPYGAFLADGSEYTGAYDVGDQDLYLFHRERWSVLAETEADLMACETLPSLRESLVLLRLLEATPDRWAWFSFSCRDDRHLADGTPIEEAAAACAAVDRVAAVGVNCTAPRSIAGLIDRIRGATDLPIIVYPNSGEIFDPAGKVWVEATGDDDWVSLACDWIERGAVGVGGCCRVGTEVITRLRASLLP